MDESLLPGGRLVCQSQEGHDGSYTVLSSINMRRCAMIRQRHHCLDIPRGLVHLSTWQRIVIVGEERVGKRPGHAKSHGTKLQSVKATALPEVQRYNRRLCCTADPLRFKVHVPLVHVHIVTTMPAISRAVLSKVPLRTTALPVELHPAAGISFSSRLDSWRALKL
jgi:hypothetical protein